MLDVFLKHIQKEFSFLAKARILLAVSGGIDSVVLAHLLSQTKFYFALAHVNFKLRGTASDEDAVFVLNLAKEWQVPFFLKEIDTKAYAENHKLSTQMAAREIRYTWFDELLKQHGYDYLLTAHHADDVIETFFINLSRSSGLQGLLGIPEINGKIIRPLLPFSRVEIYQYAVKNNILWREDLSNASNSYLRNRIRHDLIPVLQKIDANFLQAIRNSQQHLEDSNRLIEDYIIYIKKKVWKEENGWVYISIQNLKGFSNFQIILYELLKDYGFTDWNAVYKLLQAQSGKKIFSKTYFLLKDRDYLLLGVITLNKERALPCRSILNRIECDDVVFNTKVLDKTDNKDYFSSSLGEIYLDNDVIHYPVFVRKWKKGDYFYPIGMQGKKKLSDFFTDLKLSVIEKEKIHLLCDADDRIIWVVKKRLDNRFKITEKTTNILKITLQE